MKTHVKLMLAAFAAVFSASTAQAAPGAVRCGKLIDARAGRVLSDQVVVFDAMGIITSVAADSPTTLPEGITAVDLSHATCLAGLIDVHTHLTIPKIWGIKDWAYRCHARL
jgi:imidazolonepropionase-like amidohydrolase